MKDYLNQSRNQTPIKVACKCGWEGSSGELVGRLNGDELYCPECRDVFRAWPPKSAHDTAPPFLEHRRWPDYIKIK